MLFPSRISKKQLAGLCSRLSTALTAGVDMRTVWSHEVARAKGTASARMRRIAEAVGSGESMTHAFEQEGKYFPELFRELVSVGEQSGHLAEAFAQLGDNYEHQVKVRREFLMAIAWPLIELALAVVVIGLFIWGLGVVGRMTGRPIDILGGGLIGTSGLIKYATFLFCVAAVFGVIYWAMREGLFWGQTIQRLLLRVPVLGKALRSLALGRLAWALHLTANAGMDVRRSVKISLRAAKNAEYTGKMRSIDETLATGSSLCDAFGESGVFPEAFMDALHVGEQTGRVVESMEKLSDQYRAEAQAAMGVLSAIGFFVVFGVIATLIIAMVFRIFFFYLNTINEAVEMTM